jgi:hypothetical protein
MGGFNMIRCTCKWEVPGVALLVTFPTYGKYPAKDLLIQGNDDLTSFKRNCGILPLADVCDVTQCPSEYLDIADVVKGVTT